MRSLRRYLLSSVSVAALTATLDPEYLDELHSRVFETRTPRGGGLFND